KGDRGVAAEQLRALVSVREEELRRVQALSTRSSASSLEVSLAQLRLANARYRLASREGQAKEAVEQLRALIELATYREKQLQRLLQSAATSSTQLCVVRCETAYGRYRVARVEGRADDARRELRDTVEARAELAAQSRKLHGSGNLAEDDVDFT